MTSEETWHRPGDLIVFHAKFGISGMGVDYNPHGIDKRTVRDTSVRAGDIFLVLNGWYPTGCVGYREMYSFRLNKNVWVNETFADNFEQIA